MRTSLELVRSLKRGDLHIGRGARQRGLGRSRWCNDHKVSLHGRTTAIAKFSEKLQAPTGYKNRDIMTVLQSSSRRILPRVDAQASDGRTGIGGWCPVVDESGKPGHCYLGVTRRVVGTEGFLHSWYSCFSQQNSPSTDMDRQSG